MAKRKNRLKRGIASIQKQIELHEEKRRLAQELGQEELYEYFTKEIESLKERQQNRKEKADKS